MTQQTHILGRQSPEDPFPVYEKLLADGDVHWSDYYRRWTVLSYAAARQVLLDDAFLTEPVFRELIPRLEQGTGQPLASLHHLLRCTLFYADPPRHSPARRLLAKVISSRPPAELRAAAEALSSRLLDAARREGGFDLVLDYASRIPAGIIALILGVPEEDIAELARYAGEVAHVFDVLVPLRTYRRIDAAARGLIAYFAELVQRRRKAPGEDGISYMLHLAAEQGDISDADISGFCAFLFVAGEETTGSFISGGAAVLFQNPHLLAQLRDDPGKMQRAADELLRHQSPVQGVGRVATADRIVGGRTIAAGANLVIFLASADRDPLPFPDPACPMFERSGPPHLAFGLGAHSCLGASLARMEGAVAFGGLVGMPAPRFDMNEAQWAQRRIFRGLSKFPVRL
jgi:hypothetical protein